MARRSYSAELAGRNERARQLGYTSYAAQRRARALGATRPGDQAAPGRGTAGQSVEARGRAARDAEIARQLGYTSAADRRAARAAGRPLPSDTSMQASYRGSTGLGGGLRRLDTTGRTPASIDAFLRAAQRDGRTVTIAGRGDRTYLYTQNDGRGYLPAQAATRLQQLTARGASGAAPAAAGWHTGGDWVDDSDLAYEGWYDAGEGSVSGRGGT